jgi:hypothetical protein
MRRMEVRKTGGLIGDSVPVFHASSRDASTFIREMIETAGTTAAHAVHFSTGDSFAASSAGPSEHVVEIGDLFS